MQPYQRFTPIIYLCKCASPDFSPFFMKKSFTPVLLFLIALLQPALLRSQWQYARGGGGFLPDAGNSVAIDSYGSLYVGGTFNSASIVFGSFTLMNDSPGTSDIFLVKYDSSGNVIWARREGGKGDDMLKGISADNSGNVFITGNFSSPSVAFDTFVYYTNYGCSRFYLAKYTGTTGTLGWVRSYDTAYNYPGCPETYSSAIATDANGFTHISVYFVGTMVLGHDTLKTSLYDRYESLVLKYDQAGNLLREKQIYSEPYTFVVVGSIVADADCNIYASGITNGHNLYAYPISAIGAAATCSHFILKLDSSGKGRYIKKLYADDCNNYITYPLAVGSINQVYLTGYFGNAINSKIIFGGQTLNNYSPGTSDIFLAKYDSACNFVWAKQAGGNDQDIATSITTSKSGTVYIAGSINSATASFGTKSITNPAVTYLYFAAYDSTGNALYAKTTDGYSNNTASSIAAANGNTIYLTGSFYSDSIQFGVNHLYNPNAGTNNFFLAKYRETGVEDIPVISTEGSVKLYPNPVSAPGNLQVTLPADAGIETAVLFNNLGKCVYSVHNAGNSDKLQLNLPELPKGFYYLQLQRSAGSYFLRVIIN